MVNGATANNKTSTNKIPEIQRKLSFMQEKELGLHSFNIRLSLVKIKQVEKMELGDLTNNYCIYVVTN